MWIFITHLWLSVSRLRFTSAVFDCALQICGVQPGVRQGSEVWPGHARLQDREHPDVTPPHRQVTAERRRCCSNNVPQSTSPGNRRLLSPSGGSTCTSLPKGPARRRCWKCCGTQRSGCDAFCFQVFSPRQRGRDSQGSSLSDFFLFVFLQFFCDQQSST